MALTTKKIDVEFQLANGEFEGGGNETTVTGLRVSLQAVVAGYNSGKMFLTIYGLPLSTMNKLSTVGKDFLKQYKNKIAVRVGSDEEGMSVIWTGYIVNAFVDAQQMPNVALRVFSAPGAWDALKPVPPTSVSGGASATSLLRRVADTMELEYEDAGVTAVLSNPYYAGTAWHQMLSIARDAGIVVGVERGRLVAVPPGKARDGDAVRIAPDSGLVGYPAFDQARVLLTALFNPNVKFQGKIKVESDLESANGEWIVWKLQYDLESITPNGNWFMNIESFQTGDTPA